MNEIHQVNGKIATLERRAEYLERQLSGSMGEGARNFAAAELSAINAGLVALRLYRNEVEGLSGPIDVLKELIDQLEKRGDLDPELTRTLERASSVVVEFDAA